MDSWFRLQNSTHATYHTIPFSPPLENDHFFLYHHKNLQIQKMLKKDLSLFPPSLITYNTYYGAEFRISGRVFQHVHFHPSLFVGHGYC